MIELRVKDWCQNCSEFEPYVYTIDEYGVNASTFITCEHEKRCFDIVKYLKRELTLDEGSESNVKTYRA